jgi:hypothetical protein
MKFICSILIMLMGLTGPLQAKDFTGNFHGAKIKLSEATFNSQIKPLLTNITHQFLVLLETLSPPQKSSVDLQKTLRLELSEIPRLASECSLVDNNCIDDFIKTQEALHRIDLQIFSLINEFSQGLASQNFYQLDPTIKQLAIMEDMSKTVLQMSLIVMNIFNVSNTQYAHRDKSLDNLKDQYRTLRIYKEQLIPLAGPYKHLNLFERVWASYFKIIDDQILQDRQWPLLVNRVESLNFAWNEFHMTLQKDYDLKERTIKPLLLEIQNSWNQVLKIVLKP